ncbi:phosphohydrolase [Candidatus Roizmanbacteria bacterium]|nr:phosphohydrolase [Candidatus Roizmanbacteria bacterium]
MVYDREKYVDAVRNQLEPNIFKHSLALEACMGGLYDYLQSQGQLDTDEPAREDWLLAGLIHDIDFSGEFKEQHPAKTREALAKYGLEIDDTVDGIVKAHASHLGLLHPQLKSHWAIFCADSLTGLITAVALVLPSKKLADVKLSSVVKRFLKNPNFAAGTRRAEVAMCNKSEGLNLPLEKFIEICLISMQKISPELGL